MGTIRLTLSISFPVSKRQLQRKTELPVEEPIITDSTKIHFKRALSYTYSRKAVG